MIFSIVQLEVISIYTRKTILNLKYPSKPKYIFTLLKTSLSSRAFRYFYSILKLKSTEDTLLNYNEKLCF